MWDNSVNIMIDSDFTQGIRNHFHFTFLFIINSCSVYLHIAPVNLFVPKFLLFSPVANPSFLGNTRLDAGSVVNRQ